MFDSLPRERIAFLPTPLHPMPHLGDSLNLNSLWIKRDDLTGLAFGGNKIRKLEFVIGDAKENHCDTLITVGGQQSNHCRQTAAAAAKVGMRCILLLYGEEPEEFTGNLLLSRMMGAEIKYYPDDSLFTLNNRLEEVIQTLEDFGLRPYAIPAGAAMAIGSAAYAVAIEELKDQADRAGVVFDRIVVPVGTGGTMAGMLVGAHMLGMETEIVGVSVIDDAASATARVEGEVDKMFARFPEIGSFTPKIHVDDRFLSGGYGKVDDSVRSSLEMFAKMDGVILDPVYTGKAGVALIRMALSGEIPSDSSTLFYHTGGQPALFAF
ncbi:MAG: 1-aminocyclopropane-1-carboxylate deaminase/D-cysteine desulfhydrase [Candidatus Thorarchaeota archaeon]